MAIIRFGRFELDEQTLELRKSGAPVRLQQQPGRVLAFLLNHRGALVTREQIRIAIWGEDTFVDFEHGLNFCIRQIRLALSDSAENPAYIETLPRLGYRFMAKIEKSGDIVLEPEKKRLRLGIAAFEDLNRAVSDYLAAGLTEDMISALSRIDSTRLRVASVPRFAPRDPSSELDEFARRFGLDFLLRGTVRRAADKVRITAQLYDVKDKSVLWSESYDRNSSDLLAVQEEVTERVSKSLAIELFPSATVGTRRYSRSSAAYDAYLRGRFLWHKMTPNAIRSSMTCFNEALSLDGKFAPAFAGLADCYAQMGSVRVAQMKPLDALAQAHSHLDRALELDETLAEAHCTRGLIKSWYDWDWTGAEREFQVALALDPSQITVLIWQSLLLSAMGRHQEAIASVQRARESEPLSTAVNLYLGVTQTHAGQYDIALRQLQQCVDLDPGYYRTYMFLGRVLCYLERCDEAISVLEKAIALEPESIESVSFLGSAVAQAGDRKRALRLVDQVRAAEDRTEPAVLIATIYAKLGLSDELFAALDRAVAVKSTPIYIALLQEEFSPFRSEPRFRRFLDSVGLSSFTGV